MHAGPGRLLIEHHVFGRKNGHTAIAFICESCKPAVENADGPIADESRALVAKRDLFVQSSALRWVVRNWEAIAAGIVSQNRNGVSVILGPKGTGWQPPFGAVGLSGRRYYFIPSEHCDEFVEVASQPSALEDGVGGPPAGGEWVRFKGRKQNVLNKVLDIHADEGSPGVDLESLRRPARQRRRLAAYGVNPRYFLICLARALSISTWRGTGCFWPVAGLM